MEKLDIKKIYENIFPYIDEFSKNMGIKIKKELKQIEEEIERLKQENKRLRIKINI